MTTGGLPATDQVAPQPDPIVPPAPAPVPEPIAPAPVAEPIAPAPVAAERRRSGPGRR